MRPLCRLLSNVMSTILLSELINNFNINYCNLVINLTSEVINTFHFPAPFVLSAKSCMHPTPSTCIYKWISYKFNTPSMNYPASKPGRQIWLLLLNFIHPDWWIFCASLFLAGQCQLHQSKLNKCSLLASWLLQHQLPRPRFRVCLCLFHNIESFRWVWVKFV